LRWNRQGDCQEFRAEVGHDRSKGARQCRNPPLGTIFSKQIPQTVLPIVHIIEGICIVGLARRAIAQTLVLTLQRFLGLGQGLTICLTLPGPPQPSGTHLLLAGLPVHFCGKSTMTQSLSL
jgi:hypothetical protein